jgi:hypothetical protein
MEEKVQIITILLTVIAVGIAACAGGLWGIYGILQRGFSEHIKAMQAIYERTTMTK